METLKKSVTAELCQKCGERLRLIQRARPEDPDAIFVHEDEWICECGHSESEPGCS